MTLAPQGAFKRSGRSPAGKRKLWTPAIWECRISLHRRIASNPNNETVPMTNGVTFTYLAASGGVSLRLK